MTHLFLSRAHVVVSLWAFLLGGVCSVTLASSNTPRLVQNSESYGLSEAETRTLRAKLSQPEAGSTEHARARVKEYASKGVDIVPFLLGLRELGPESGKEAGISQSTLVLWLALTHDQRANEHLLATYRELLQTPIRTRGERYFLIRMTYSLGLTNSEAAIDLLFRVQSDDFWESDSAPAIESAETDEGASISDVNDFIDHIKGMALQALANTGSDRVVKALGTHEGIARSQLDVADALFRVAIESKEGLPDVAKWREKGLPERKLNEMRALVDWWQEAEAYGIELPHAKALLRDLERPASQAIIREKKAYYHENNVDIGPFLIHLLEGAKLPETRGAPVGAIAEGTILFWMAEVGGESLCEYLLNHVKQIMKGPITSGLQLQAIEESIFQLGMSGCQSALDYLFMIQSKEFWESANAPVVELPASARRSPAQEAEKAVERIQVRALSGLAASGTDRVIHAFATGEGINPAYQNHLASLFKSAARFHFNIVGAPELYGQPLPEETLKGLQDLYAKYGKTYVPEKAHEKVKQMSTPH